MKLLLPLKIFLFPKLNPKNSFYTGNNQSKNDDFTLMKIRVIPNLDLLKRLQEN